MKILCGQYFIFDNFIVKYFQTNLVFKKNVFYIIQISNFIELNAKNDIPDYIPQYYLKLHFPKWRGLPV